MYFISSNTILAWFTVDMFIYVLVFLGNCCKCSLRNLRLIIATNRYWFGPISETISESNGTSKLSNGEVSKCPDDDDTTNDEAHPGTSCGVFGWFLLVGGSPREMDDRAIADDTEYKLPSVAAARSWRWLFDLLSDSMVVSLHVLRFFDRPISKHFRIYLQKFMLLGIYVVFKTIKHISTIASFVQLSVPCILYRFPFRLIDKFTGFTSRYKYLAQTEFHYQIY